MYIENIPQKNTNIFEKVIITIFLKIILEKNEVLKVFGKKNKSFNIWWISLLNPIVGIFFNKLGLSLLQGYGQTEASPLISCNRKKIMILTQLEIR